MYPMRLEHTVGSQQAARHDKKRMNLTCSSCPYLSARVRAACTPQHALMIKADILTRNIRDALPAMPSMDMLSFNKHTLRAASLRASSGRSAAQHKQTCSIIPSLCDTEGICGENRNQCGL